MSSLKLKAGAALGKGLTRLDLTVKDCKPFKQMPPTRPEDFHSVARFEIIWMIRHRQMMAGKGLNRGICFAI